MHIRLAAVIIPAVLATLSSVPSFAQIRVGVDLGAIFIRIAPEGPPPPRMERRMRRPGPQHVWIEGYWDRRDDRWAWESGRWEEPARRGSYWIKPQYHRESGAIRYEPGRWSHQRVDEGEDYSRWKKEHGRDEGKGNNGRGPRRDDRRGP
jgi:hypothetical protein